MTRSTISLLVFLVGIALVLVASSVSAATGKVLRGNTIANNNNNKYAVSSTNRGRRAPQLGRPDAGVVMPDFDNFDAIKAAVESYDTYPMATSSAQNPQYKITPIDTVINNQLVHGHVTTLSNPIGHYNIMPSPHGCPGALQVSTSASYYGCEVAYNAGFFDLITQTCIGNIISNGKVVQMQSTNYNGVQFGTTASGDYVIGYLNNTEIENLKLTNLVGGNMWLVRNGASYIDTAISIERPGMRCSLLNAACVDTISSGRRHHATLSASTPRESSCSLR
eukprot:GEZU01023291.1.p1 GENE.GEZU01023291.1~~GEZU01023291.1.p1  ORF type:complete len:279 (-),score=30.64 GEZU01023291.1:273-1109(-)